MKLAQILYFGGQGTPYRDSFLDLLDLRKQLACLGRVIPEIRGFGELFLFFYRCFQCIRVKDAPRCPVFLPASRRWVLRFLRAYRFSL